MRLPIYQIAAFTCKLFKGNPAAVIPLDCWISETLMQNIALENNLSETVFFVASTNTDADFDIRWFTPAVEINLCGHATLATAFVLFNFLGFDKKVLKFNSKSGILTVTKKEELLTMDFPSWKPERLDVYPDSLNEILGEVKIVSVYKYRDILIELASEEDVKNCQPDFNLMQKHFDTMIITAQGKKVDFISRFFAPGAGINEDPVTGSAHAQLIPFWSEKLNKNNLHALQLSDRGGELWCTQLNAERVSISGNCVFYMQGEITLADT